MPWLRSPSFAVAAVAAMLAGCAAHEAPSSELVEDYQDFDEEEPVTRVSAELPHRVLPPAEAASAPLLTLTANDGTALRLTSMRVEGSVQEPLAFTELHLVFENPEARALDGRFDIELPPHAAIARFAVKVGEHWREGEVVARQSALPGSRPEATDPAPALDTGIRFQAQVHAIPARDRQELVVAWSQALPESEVPYRVALRGLPRLDRLDARILVEHGASEEVLELHEAGWLPDRDLEVRSRMPRRALGIRHAGIAVARVTPLLHPLPPDPVNDLTILFDTSASRALGYANKVRRLGELVAALRERQGDFPLRVAAFDQEVSLVFSGQASEFGASELDQLYTRRPLGASDLAVVLRRAVTVVGDHGRLLLVTDGLATAGLDEPGHLESAAIGLGRRYVRRVDAIVDGSPAGRRALEPVARAYDGMIADARLPVARLAEKLLAATHFDMSIAVDGGEVVWPTKLDGVQPGDEVLVYAELPAEATTMTVVIDEDQRIEVPLVEVEAPLIWHALVGARLEALQAELAVLTTHDDEAGAELRQDIVELSMRTRVVSELTGLLVLETRRDYASHGITRRNLADLLAMGPDGPLRQRRRKLAPPSALSEAGSDPDDAPRVAALPDPDHEPSMDDQGDRRAGADDASWRAPARPTPDASVPTVGVPLGRVARPAAPSSSVRQGKPIVKGRVDYNVVRRIVRAHVSEVRDCYEQGLARDETLAGHVTVRFVIDHEGRVVTAELDEPSLPDTGVTECIAAAVPGWRFPKPTDGRTTSVTQSFELAPGREPPPTPAELAAQAEAWRVHVTKQRAALVERDEQASMEAGHYTGRMRDVMSELEAGRVAPGLDLAVAWSDEAPGDPLALLALGEALERNGLRHAAARAYGSLVDLYPGRADLRRYAGSRLEPLGELGLTLALDCYRHALDDRPDQPSSHRMFAWALLRTGMYASAWDALVAGLERQRRSPSSEGVERIFEEDLGLVAAAWLQAEPRSEPDIRARVALARIEIATAPSTRFVLTWEGDAHDVDLHVHDATGGHAHAAARALASGGTLYGDVFADYGPECFTIDGEAQAGPYRLQARFHERDPLGLGLGMLQTIEHDGEGGLRLRYRPFFATKDQATVELGTLEPGWLGF